MGNKIGWSSEFPGFPCPEQCSSVSPNATAVTRSYKVNQNNIEAILQIANDGDVRCARILATDDPAAPYVHYGRRRGEGDDCYYNNAGTSGMTTYTDSPFYGQICCCMDFVANPGLTAQEACPLEVPTCKTYGRSKERCDALTESSVNQCVWLVAWKTERNAALRAWAGRVRRAKGKRKRIVARKFKRVQRYYAACEGGCQNALTCSNLCKPVCDNHPNCVWKTSGPLRGCQKSTTAAPTFDGPQPPPRPPLPDT